MSEKNKITPQPLPKITTGIHGFDELPQPHQQAESQPPTPRHRGGDAVTDVVMRLYIAEGAPNSVEAVANLEAICKEHLNGYAKLEIIDVLKYPLRALADGIVVTPSLAKLSPSPEAKVIGNLSDKGSVLRALAINGQVK